MWPNIYLPIESFMRERFFIGLMASDRKLKASREGSKGRIYLREAETLRRGGEHRHERVHLGRKVDIRLHGKGNSRPVY